MNRHPQEKPHSDVQNNALPVVSESIVAVLPGSKDAPQVVYRLAGDAYLLVEYGLAILDLNLRFRVHALQQELVRTSLDGIQETIPGVRSLLIKYDCLQLSMLELTDALQRIEADLPASNEVEVSSRVVHLPIAFHDQWTREAVAKYQQSVRAEAPYLPDNMEFVARCNALDSTDQVSDHIQKTQTMVIGLGDVYLGAPCAVPLDPRFRLEAPKYNPARTYTCEGAVGIGGAFMCIYPMESPGGYQLIGRTLPIWNTRQNTPDFKEAPWLLRLFDRIQFEQVSEAELMQKRQALLSGEYRFKIEEGTFSMSEYNAFLIEIKNETQAIKAKRDLATERWTKGY